MRISDWSSDVCSSDLVETLPYYWGDLDMLATVLINLIDNAVKYSPDHSLIGIVARATPDAILLSVADRGIGIPPAEAGLIGRGFFRASTTNPAPAATSVVSGQRASGPVS